MLEYFSYGKLRFPSRNIPISSVRTTHATHSSPTSPTSPTSYLYFVQSNDPPLSYYPQQVRYVGLARISGQININKSIESSTMRANNRLGEESSENFSRTDALRLAWRHQSEVSPDRILVSNEHHRVQKLPLHRGAMATLAKFYGKMRKKSGIMNSGLYTMPLFLLDDLLMIHYN